MAEVQVTQKLIKQQTIAIKEARAVYAATRNSMTPPPVVRNREIEHEEVLELHSNSIHRNYYDLSEVDAENLQPIVAGCWRALGGVEQEPTADFPRLFFTSIFKGVDFYVDADTLTSRMYSRRI
jgi:hypothetical protein